jgi:hypothetical protein
MKESTSPVKNYQTGPRSGQRIADLRNRRRLEHLANQLAEREGRVAARLQYMECEDEIEAARAARVRDGREAYSVSDQASHRACADRAHGEAADREFDLCMSRGLAWTSARHARVFPATTELA